MGTPRNKSVQKAFTMLRAFREPDEWLTSAELSRRANLPEASGYRLIQTLLGIGAVIRDDRGRYGPGMLLVTLSKYVAYEKLLRGYAGKILESLAEELNLITHMGVLDDGMVTYVVRAGPKGGIRVQTSEGIQLEPYCTGLGKVLLSGLSRLEFDRFLLDGELVPLTPNTIVDPAALREEVKKVRDQGWAMDDCEMDSDLRCLAVPVKDAAGTVVAAISSSGTPAVMNEDKIRVVRNALVEAAAKIGSKVTQESGASPFRPIHDGIVPSADTLACMQKMPAGISSRLLGQGSAFERRSH
jgi:DNA-binding IclR family transcriptional regulator